MSALRTLRARLTAVAALVVLAGVTVLLAAFNLVLERNLDREATRQARTLAAAAATTVTVSGGTVRVRESPADEAIDRFVWVYDGARAVLRAPGAAAVQRAADELAANHRDRADVGESVRLVAEPIGRATVVAGVSLTAYERTSHVALLASVVLGALLLLAVSALTWLMMGRALHPVESMTASAADWSEHEMDRRFGAQPRPDELARLAATFDGLLDRLAASLRHEQRLSAELSHELRTPLARIVAEVELLERRERSTEERAAAHAVIARSAEQMRGILETLMVAARAEAGATGRSDAGAILDRVREQWPGVVVHPPPGRLTVGVDADVAVRLLAPLLENAVRHAAARVDVTAEARDGGVAFTVADDGPGVPAGAEQAAFEPGARLDPGDGHDGAGLGLALARRLARAAGGDITAQGARFTVRLPG
jgi:signal transduction histidine kinase